MQVETIITKELIESIQDTDQIAIPEHKMVEEKDAIPEKIRQKIKDERLIKK